MNLYESNPMPQMSFHLSEIDVSDAENIARYIDVPSMQNGPLYRTMFPRSDMTEKQKEEIIRWYVDMLEDAFQDGKESFLKGCSVDGTPVGFCGWTIIERNRHVPNRTKDAQADKSPKRERWEPELIDIDGWIALSKALRTERDRVLKDLDNICRTLVSLPALHQLTDELCRPDLYGRNSEPSTTRDWFGGGAADLRRDRSAWTMCICACSTRGSSTVCQVWLRDCWSC